MTTNVPAIAEHWRQAFAVSRMGEGYKILTCDEGGSYELGREVGATR